jgi:hypothetical protein
MFDTNNYEGLKAVQEFMPEQFDMLKKAKLDSILKKSQTAGELDPKKLINNVKKLEKESREIIFGKGSQQVFDDINTVLDNIPTKVGTSDTPRGNAWSALFSPSHYSKEMGDAFQYMLLKSKTNKVKGLVGIASEAVTPGGSGSKLGKAGKGLLNTSRAMSVPNNFMNGLNKKEEGDQNGR